MNLFFSRLLRLVAVLLAVTTASFAMISLLPGDLVTNMLGANATQADRDAVRQELHLDDPVPVRYARWLGNAVQGDLGISYRTRQPVAEALGQRLGVTMELVLLSQLIALAFAIPMAIFGALRPGSILDRILSGVQLAMLATPGYLVAITLMAIFAVKLGWFDTTGFTHLTDDPLGNLKSLLLPSIALALEQVALYARILRTDLVATFDQDYIWYTRAKGQPTRRIVVNHALRPSSIGLVTITGVSLGRMIGGTVLVEFIFALPGLGRFTIDAINNRDFMSLQGAVVVLTVGFVLVNFLVDILLGVIDPRIRARGREVTAPAHGGDTPDGALPPPRWGLAVYLSVAWLVLLVLAAVFADWLHLYKPDDTRAGIPLSVPTGRNWLGTDEIGRDLLSRTIYGARVSIIVGLAAVLLSSIVGGFIGLIAGYYRKVVETFTLFSADVLMAFPTMLLAASIVAFTKSRGMATVVMVIALIYLGPTIRIVRALTLSIASREFVTAARSVGATNARTIRHEIMPNVIPTLMSMMVVAIAGAIVAEGGLAYLNLSVAPPQPTWGAMIAAGKPKLDKSLYPVLVPGGALFLTVLALTLIGDAIQKRQARNLGVI